ncbi:GTP cyclohydrolase IIa [Sulfurisphaera javensis]|uniref:GTP cyclohydrolase III n=1 Tax=Sulfurisphaera javensis TaxID=2049879 RepID=A0AAT9GRF0_9CREN
MKIAEINLEGYKEWTESLGYDREWKIQSFQHNFLSELTQLASEINSFAVTYRYDSYILLLDGAEISKIDQVISKIRDLSPVPIKVCYGYGKTFLEAEKNCEHGEKISDFNDEKILVAHFDLDGFTRRRYLFDAYLEIFEVYNKIFNIMQNLGGLAYYFGGDNIGAFLNVEMLNHVKDIVESISGLKVGVGIGNNPREGLKNAAKALHIIRLYRDRKIEIVQS